MFVDSHCHLDRLDLGPFDHRFEQLVTACRERQVEHMLCVAIDLESYPAMRRLVDGYPDISVSVGVHPNESSARSPGEEELVELAADPKVVAIGETGLDYYRTADLGPCQQDRFRRHIRAAKAARKPLIVHTRQAREATLAILREEGARDVGGVLHCFTEDWEMAKGALDLNFYISFSGIVTFRNAAPLQEVARKVPEDRLLIETDSPYLAPVPHRGKANYPFLVRHVAEVLAQVRGISVESVAAASARNFYTLFAGVRSLM
ncbi:TatD family hydrolase [Candidatus Methylocalor cossyra]|uniref:Metal-dependent hydrolase YcfH n=1 Tax=Candidatus Methylocalor cossyra TaxID=3108543 RepID=A0ABP1C3W2_9GAMM